MPFILLLCSALAWVALAVGAPVAAQQQQQQGQPQCATRCHTESCDSFGIRYGRFCGVGHGGCPGVEPCDPVDKCCKGHDDCVEKNGVMDAKCHRRFLKCLTRHEGKDHEGFAPDKCPYNVVIPTMRSGIELAMMFSGGASNGQQPSRSRDL